MGTSNRYSPEVGERAVRLVLEQQGEAASQWAVIESSRRRSAAPAETLRHWVRQAERDLVRGTRPSTPTSSIGAGRGRGSRTSSSRPSEWVAWYNHRRLLAPLGYVPPAEFEQAYYDRQGAPGAMAVLT
jgi:transposase InsO family protein